MNIEYLLFDLIIVSASTLSVYFYRAAQWPHLKSALQAICALAIPYLVWDAAVTGKWWDFNPNYIVGFTLLGLPIEEWLFFLVVPWSMLLLWHNRKLVLQSSKVEWGKWLFGALAIVGIWVATQSWYGLIVANLYFVLLIVIRDKIALLDWAVLALTTCIATLIFNSYLTWKPVVIYQEAEISGFRLGTIPVEDFYYGLVLVLGVIYVYERLIANNQKVS